MDIYEVWEYVCRHGRRGSPPTFDEHFHCNPRCSHSLDD